MEDRRPDPSVHAHGREDEIVSFHWMPIRYSALDFYGSSQMEEHVQPRERDGGWLLHARESPERPLAVVLVNSVAARDSSISNEMHALVLAVIVAGPTGEAERKR